MGHCTGGSTLETSAVGGRGGGGRMRIETKHSLAVKFRVNSDYVRTRQTRILLCICNFLNFTNFDVKCALTLKEIDFRDFPRNKFKIFVMFAIEEMLDRSDSE